MIKLYIMIMFLFIFMCLEIKAGDFNDNNDWTVTDDITGLMWQQDDDNITRNWEGAITYCENLSLGKNQLLEDYEDWRLPNIKELKSIVNYTISLPSIDTTYFPNTNHVSGDRRWHYWTSTTNSAMPIHAWSGFFDYGDFVSTLDKSFMGYVRCVRGGQ